MHCSFCARTMNPGTGKMYVKKDGGILYFCSMKCEKNQLKLGRKPYAAKWTDTYHAEKKAHTERKDGKRKV